MLRHFNTHLLCFDHDLRVNNKDVACSASCVSPMSLYGAEHDDASCCFEFSREILVSEEVSRLTRQMYSLCRGDAMLVLTLF